jgi:deoxyribose-phosphate aldolase
MSGTSLVTARERALAVLGGEADDATLRRYLHGIAGVDAVGLEQRAAGLGTRSIKTTSKRWALDKII